jgi:hypothetical protein
MAGALLLRVGMTTTPEPTSYLAARIAAFVTAHTSTRLCLTCAQAQIKRRRTSLERLDEPGWCTGCGSRSGVGFRVAVVTDDVTSPGWRPRRRPRARPGQAARRDTGEAA